MKIKAPSPPPPDRGKQPLQQLLPQCLAPTNLYSVRGPKLGRLRKLRQLLHSAQKLLERAVSDAAFSSCEMGIPLQQLQSPFPALPLLIARPSGISLVMMQ